jgi:DNA replication protein DnaC
VTRLAFESIRKVLNSVPMAQVNSEALSQDKETLTTVDEGGEEEWKARVEPLARHSGIPLHTRKGPDALRLDTWRKRGGTSLDTAFQLAKEMASGEAAFSIYTLAGPTGVGKTHLAIAIGWDWIERGRWVKFHQVGEMLDELRATFDKTEKSLRGDEPFRDLTFEELFTQLKDCDLLILDDLGAECQTRWATEKLDSLINHRYLHRKAMVVTTNAKSEDLPPRIADRLSDTRKARIAQMSTSSYRRVDIEKKGEVDHEG